ncbi:MAG: amidase [Ruminococcaceae bacterium]|nr:amidase [Oscillospiraceae bacterium]
MKGMTNYDRASAVKYAHKWAFERNPRFYNYDKVGGDCTNFASQCLLAGNSVMNYTPTLGWYYVNANQKSPAWTGVEYFYNFLTRRANTVGPKAVECEIHELQPGDIVQLSTQHHGFEHTPVVVAVSEPFDPEHVLVAAHSYDADYRPVSTYNYVMIRFLHIEGVISDNIIL